MKVRILVATACAALVLSACGTPGPHLSYDEFLPNTNENPAWARSSPQPPDGQVAPSPRDAAPTR